MIFYETYSFPTNQVTNIFLCFFFKMQKKIPNEKKKARKLVISGFVGEKKKIQFSALKKAFKMKKKMKKKKKGKTKIH